MLKAISFWVALWGSLSSVCFADSSDIDSSGQYRSYYEIEEPDAQKFAEENSGFQSPLEMMQLTVDELKNIAASLLRWSKQNDGWPEPNEKYNRRVQFGGWLYGHGTIPACRNTRAKVLMRDTHENVEFSHTGCTVVSGRWSDPYTGQSFDSARDIQIDHMVPLKNAYISGAWKWDNRTRCAYTNFMANEFHLIAVSGRENMRKSDRTPAEWVPPNRAYLCTYLKNWLKVKLIWGLIMNPGESLAIKRQVKEAGCSSRDFTIEPTELAEQRRAIQISMAGCR